jgi:selenocysteine lyase/cysteine desulfurase
MPSPLLISKVLDYTISFSFYCNFPSFLLDSAQGAGILPIDVEEQKIDILTFTGHKGLYGPQGTGGFYLRPGLELRSLIEGGTGSLSEAIIQPEFLPDKFESGTPNTPGIAGLAAGVRFVLDTSLEAIRHHELQLMAQLTDGLKDITGVTLYGPEDNLRRTSVLSLNLKGLECGELSFALDERFGIITRSGLHCAPLAHQTIGTLQQGTCRVSLSYFNSREEITFFLEAMRKLSSEL